MLQKTRLHKEGCLLGVKSYGQPVRYQEAVAAAYVDGEPVTASEVGAAYAADEI